MIRRFLIWSFCLACVVSLPTTAAAQAVPVGIAWDANDDDPEGYTVFIGTQPGVYTEVIDVGKNTFYVYSDGVPGQRYYFTVAAYKPKPHVGPKATEVSHVLETFAVAALEPPVVNGSTVTLRWQSQSSTPIVDYLLEAGTATGMRNIFSGSVGTDHATLGNRRSRHLLRPRQVPRTTTHIGTCGQRSEFSIGGWRLQQWTTRGPNRRHGVRAVGCRLDLVDAGARRDHLWRAGRFQPRPQRHLRRCGRAGHVDQRCGRARIRCLRSHLCRQPVRGQPAVGGSGDSLTVTDATR